LDPFFAKIPNFLHQIFYITFEGLINYLLRKI